MLGELTDPDKLAESTIGTSIEVSDDGGELISEGSWVAEAVLWTPWVHLGDLQAQTECQVITIEASIFGETIQMNRPLWLSVQKYALKFMDALNRVRCDSLTDLCDELFSPTDAIDQDDFHKDNAEALLEVQPLGILARFRSSVNRLSAGACSMTAGHGSEASSVDRFSISSFRQSTQHQ